jgi:hypothetical protein
MKMWEREKRSKLYNEADGVAGERSPKYLMAFV